MLSVKDVVSFFMACQPFMLTFLELIIQEKSILTSLYIFYIHYLPVYFHYTPIKEGKLNLSILIHG